MYVQWSAGTWAAIAQGLRWRAYPSDPSSFRSDAVTVKRWALGQADSRSQLAWPDAGRGTYNGQHFPSTIYKVPVNSILCLTLDNLQHQSSDIKKVSLLWWNFKFLHHLIWYLFTYFCSTSMTEQTRELIKLNYMTIYQGIKTFIKTLCNQNVILRPLLKYWPGHSIIQDYRLGYKKGCNMRVRPVFRPCTSVCFKISKVSPTTREHPSHCPRWMHNINRKCCLLIYKTKLCTILYWIWLFLICYHLTVNYASRYLSNIMQPISRLSLRMMRLSFRLYVLPGDTLEAHEQYLMSHSTHHGLSGWQMPLTQQVSLVYQGILH